MRVYAGRCSPLRSAMRLRDLVAVTTWSGILAYSAHERGCCRVIRKTAPPPLAYFRAVIQEVAGPMFGVSFTVWFDGGWIRPSLSTVVEDESGGGAVSECDAFAGQLFSFGGFNFGSCA